MSSIASIGSMMIPHEAFSRALEQVDVLFKRASTNHEPEGLAIVGESGTGKSTVLKYLAGNHPSSREADGMRVPILHATVPPVPTIKGLASKMLEAFEDPDAHRGTESEKTSRLHAFIRGCGTRVIVLDEFQHFVDSMTDAKLYTVANWLKTVIEETRATVIVSGLPSCLAVVTGNSQLRRRFRRQVELPQFDWFKSEQKSQFGGILKAYHSEFMKHHVQTPLPDLDFAYRMWIATGGLMAYVCKLVGQVAYVAAESDKREFDLSDFDRAYEECVWEDSPSRETRSPFNAAFPIDSTEVVRKFVSKIVITEEAETQTRKKPKMESVNSLLSK